MKHLLILVALVMTGCVPQKNIDWSAYEAADPQSILVVPVVNNTLNVDAPNYMLSTLSVPLAERGYYVYPVNTVKVILEQEGFYEAEQIHGASSASLAEMFNAEAILYVTIQRWDAKYALFSTSVTVQFDYLMVNSEGAEIWEAEKKMVYTPENNDSGDPLVNLLVMAISAAVTRAAPNYMPLARSANQQVMVLGPTALPAGPYTLDEN